MDQKNTREANTKFLSACPSNRQEGDQAVAIEKDEAKVIICWLEAVEEESVLVHQAKASPCSHTPRVHYDGKSGPCQHSSRLR